MYQSSAKAMKSVAQLSLCLSLALPLMFVTGCGVSTAGLTDAASPTSATQGVPISGHVHGGQQPITGATVKLWTVGAAGYGSAAYSIASTTTDSTGSFSFANYTCTGTSFAYLTASGGNPGGSSTNSAIKLLAVLAAPSAAKPIVEEDICSNVKTNNPDININEISTVTAIYALAQFFNPATESIGASSTNPLGLANAFNNVGYIMNVPTGTVNATYSPYGYAYDFTSNNQITATPEQQKIYLIADIIASCVNSVGPTSPACSTLFGAAVPPPSPAVTTLGSSFSYPTATDTLQAAYYMAINPIDATTAGVANTANITNLYGLASTTSPFPSNSPQPTDWTIAVTFGSTSLCSDSGCTAYVISAPTSLAIDQEGDPFFLNATLVANLPTAPTYCAGTAPSNTYTTCNNFTGLMPYGGLGVSRYSADTPITGLAFDTGNNATQSSQGSMSFSLYSSHNPGSGTASRSNYHIQFSYEFVPGSTSAYFADSNAATVDINGVAYAGDSTNMYFPVVSNGYVYSTPNTQQSSTDYQSSPPTTPYALTALNNNHPIAGFTAATQIAVDQISNVWVTAPGNNAVYSMPSGSTGSMPTAYTTGLYQPTGIAIDHANNAWVVNSGGNTAIGALTNGYIAEITAAGTIMADTVAGDGGIDYPAAVAIDGAGNVWVASTGTGASFTGETVSEFANASAASAPYFTALSPSVGFVHSYTGPGTASIAVDLSGNVWVANSGGYATSTVPGTVTMILGAAVPTYTPLARAIKNGDLATLP